MEFSFKMGWPDILKPEVPGINTLKKMAKLEPVTVLRLGDNGKSINICDMMLGDKWLTDDLKKISYMVNHDSIKLRSTSSDSKPYVRHAYIVDDATASTISLPDFLKKAGQDVKIEVLTVGGEKIINLLKDITVPERIKGYVCAGSTISLVSSDQNKKWYSPGPSAWDWFLDNKGVKDMFPSSVNPGWFAVVFVVGVVLGGLVCFIAGVLLGKLLLG